MCRTRRSCGRHPEGRQFKKVVTPRARREAVAYVRETRKLSQRRACRALGIRCSLVRYRFRRKADTALRERMRTSVFPIKMFRPQKTEIRPRQPGAGGLWLAPYLFLRERFLEVNGNRLARNWNNPFCFKVMPQYKAAIHKCYKFLP